MKCPLANSIKGGNITYGAVYKFKQLFESQLVEKILFGHDSFKMENR